MYARVLQAMAQFVLKIEKLFRIIGPTPILEMTRAYGLHPRLWLLAENNKGLLLRPGAMAEGVERAAKRRMRPVGFHMTIYKLLKIWKAKTLKQTNR